MWLAAATAAKLPVACTCAIKGEFSLTGFLLGVLLTSCGLLLGVEVALLQLEFSTELLVLLFNVALGALIAVGFKG